MCGHPWTGETLAQVWNRGSSTLQQKDGRQERECRKDKGLQWRWKLERDPEDLTRLRVCTWHATQDWAGKGPGRISRSEGESLQSWWHFLEHLSHPSPIYVLKTLTDSVLTTWFQQFIENHIDNQGKQRKLNWVSIFLGFANE